MAKQERTLDTHTVAWDPRACRICCGHNCIHPVVAPLGNIATRLVELELAVVAVVPLNVTISEDPKFGL
jgi:hypothetical protein